MPWILCVRILFKYSSVKANVSVPALSIFSLMFSVFSQLLIMINFRPIYSKNKMHTEQYNYFLIGSYERMQ